MESQNDCERRLCYGRRHATSPHRRPGRREGRFGVNYSKTTPCDNCPFRSDKPFHLSAGRVREIQRGLVRSTFPCHKTTEAGGSTKGESAEVHCAGALILLEKLEEPSQMMRICERIGVY